MTLNDCLGYNEKDIKYENSPESMSFRSENVGKGYTNTTRIEESHSSLLHVDRHRTRWERNNREKKNMITDSTLRFRDGQRHFASKKKIEFVQRLQKRIIRKTSPQRHAHDDK